MDEILRRRVRRREEERRGEKACRNDRVRGQRKKDRRDGSGRG